MNVNDVAKMNQLIKELQKHGIAQNAPDAFNQAQDIVSDEPKKVVTINEEGVHVETAQVGSAIIESRVNLLLDMHNKKIESNFTMMRDTISALAMEIEKLKFELKKFADSKAKVVQVVQETQKALKTEEKAPHPRQGNYQPGDVAIDKMFYFGHK
jgi:FtsZ-binding cell division protein ZapB